MSRAPASFSVKLTHRLIQTNPEVEQTQSNPVGYTINESNRKQGSSQGMTIKTTETSMEDHY